MLDGAANRAARLAVPPPGVTLLAMNRDALRATAEEALRSPDERPTWPARRVLAELVLKHLANEDEAAAARPPLSRWVFSLWVAYFAGVGVLAVSTVRWLLSLL